MFNIIYALAGGFLLGCVACCKNMFSSRALKIEPNPQEECSIAAVIATKNEEEVIENTIRTLLSDAPPSLRAIVVDKSDDSTPAILERLSTEFQNLVLLRHEGPPGKPAALNIALEHVTEDVVLFLDADARLSWESITQYMRAFCRPKIQAVFANFSCYNTKRTLAVVLHDVYFSFAKAFVFSGLFSKPVFMTSGFFVRREVLNTVGRFDTNTIVDDFDLYLRMGNAGVQARFLHGPKCKIQYAFRMKEMLKQHCRWDTGWIRHLYEQICRGRIQYVPVLGAVGLLVFFPYLILILTFVLHSPFFLTVVLPVSIAAAYGAALCAYLFYDAHNVKEAIFNILLGMFLVFVLFQLTIVISSIKAFRKRQSWYKATRERA